MSDSEVSQRKVTLHRTGPGTFAVVNDRGAAINIDTEFPDDDGGERARSFLPTALEQSHDRLCTFTRTVVCGTAVTFHTPDREVIGADRATD